MKIKPKIVIGLGHGCEGKGSMVDYLCKTEDVKLVVRFSGGHNAKHTVHVTDAHRTKMKDIKKGTKHVFSNFGSGTLSGVPTFWSRYCTLSPAELALEYDVLCKTMDPKDIVLHVDPLAPVVTPYDAVYNRMTESVNEHGSTGVGLLAAVERHEDVKLYAMDLVHDRVLGNKLDGIERWYIDKKLAGFDARIIAHFKNETSKMLDTFQHGVIKSNGVIKITREEDLLYDMSSNNGKAVVVFEGSHGILLDQSHGFFPNVTRANTTSKNAMEMLDRWRQLGNSGGAVIDVIRPEVIYVTRSYITRHGNGPLGLENDRGLKLKNLSGDTNKTNKWQGELRRGMLEIDRMKYSLECDRIHSRNATRSLAVTCLDQIDRANSELPMKNGEFPVETKNNVGMQRQTCAYSALKLAGLLGMDGGVYTSSSPTGMSLEISSRSIKT